MTDRYLPGPGDLDPGPHGCAGGACPHDHTVAVVCESCGHEFDTDRDDVCDPCRQLLHTDREDLVGMLIDTRRELARARRRLLRSEVDDRVAARLREATGG